VQQCLRRFQDFKISGFRLGDRHVVV
jgi:hypothetical protein